MFSVPQLHLSPPCRGTPVCHAPLGQLLSGLLWRHQTDSHSSPTAPVRSLASSRWDLSHLQWQDRLPLHRIWLSPFSRTNPLPVSSLTVVSLILYDFLILLSSPPDSFQGSSLPSLCLRAPFLPPPLTNCSSASCCILPLSLPRQLRNLYCVFHPDSELCFDEFSLNCIFLNFGGGAVGTSLFSNFFQPIAKIPVVEPTLCICFALSRWRFFCPLLPHQLSLPALYWVSAVLSGLPGAPPPAGDLLRFLRLLFFSLIIFLKFTLHLDRSPSPSPLLPHITSPFPHYPSQSPQSKGQPCFLYTFLWALALSSLRASVTASPNPGLPEPEFPPPFTGQMLLHSHLTS